MRAITVLGCVLALTAAATRAHGAKIVVKKGGPVSTIQDGIDLAGPGDTVLVKKGVYQETVTVPTGKDGLHLVAKGLVVIDARAPGGAGLGSAVTIASNDVELRGFTIRHPAKSPTDEPGHGVVVTGHGAMIRECRIFRCEGHAIELVGADGVLVEKCFLFGAFGAPGVTGRGVAGSGDGVVVRKTKIEAIDGDALDLTGASVRVENCTLARLSGDAIAISGNDASVQKCRIEQTDSTAVGISGAGGSVVKNRIENVRGSGVSILGDDAAVTGNRVSSFDDTGIFVGGANALVDKNRIDAGNGGISVVGDGAVVDQNRIERCYGSAAISVDGLDPTVSANLCRRVAEASEAIVVSSAQSGSVVDNEVRFSAGTGLLVDSSAANLEIRGNVVRDGGSSGSAAFLVRGSGCLLADNLAKGIGGDGFRIEADGVQLAGNRAERCTIDGIDVESGDGCSLDGNTVKKCEAEGIENNGTNTVVTNNTAGKNRTDFANDGTVQTFTGNKIADGSDTTTAPEVD